MASGKKYGYPFIKKTFTNSETFRNQGTADLFNYVIPTGYKPFSFTGFKAQTSPVATIDINAVGTQYFFRGASNSHTAGSITVEVVFIREDLNITGITGSTGTT